MKRFALLALPLALAACGDNLDEVIDAPVIDAQIIDAPPPIDAAVDARPITYSATVSLLEAAVLNTGTAGTFFGQGLQIGVTFTSSDPAVFPGPVLEETPGSPLGCKAWDLTAAQAAAATIGLDEGAVQVTSTAGTTPPAFPPCVFAAGAGYICPETTTQSTGGTISAGSGPLVGLPLLTDADVTFTAGNTSNRYVRIAGATNAANNGVFPVLAQVAANTIGYANPAFVAETIPATGFHINLAGVGPTPNAADPGFLRDDNDASFVLTAGGGNHVPGFTMTTGAGTVGDDFVLSAASLPLMNAIPRTNAPFTLACDSASCAAGSGSGILVNIVTTDTSVAGLSAFTMPPPTTRRIQVRCSLLGQSSVTVPAAFAALLGTAGVTRIQTTVIRPTLLGLTPATAIAGHAIVGFTTVP